MIPVTNSVEDIVTVDFTVTFMILSRQVAGTVEIIYIEAVWIQSEATWWVVRHPDTTGRNRNRSRVRRCRWHAERWRIKLRCSGRRPRRTAARKVPRRRRNQPTVIRQIDGIVFYIADRFIFRSSLYPTGAAALSMDEALRAVDRASRLCATLARAHHRRAPAARHYASLMQRRAASGPSFIQQNYLTPM